MTLQISSRNSRLPGHLPFCSGIDMYPPYPTVCAVKCRDMTANEPGHAPDVVIEAVGFHYCKSWLHTIEVRPMAAVVAARDGDSVLC